MKRTLHVATVFLVAATTIATAARPAAGQDPEPGRLDMATIDAWFDREPWLEINIRGALLRLAAEASRHEDPELPNLLQRLKAIEVRGYPLAPSQLEDVDRRIGDLARQLRSAGWETVVRVRRTGDQLVDVFLREHDEIIAGLVVMVVQPEADEGVVIVNIVGDVDPAQIGRIGRRFNIGPLSDIESTE